MNKKNNDPYYDMFRAPGIDMKEVPRKYSREKIVGLRLEPEQFSHIFAKLLAKGGVTTYKINIYTGVDYNYLECLKKGEKSNPGLQVLILICLALTHYSDKISIEDIEELFQSSFRSLLVARVN